MALRTTASRTVALLLAALLLGTTAPVALAQSGNGLYEPFPEAAVKKRAQRYVERLGERLPEAGRRYSDADLAAGVFVRADPGAAVLKPVGGGASRRAGHGGSADVALPIQALLLAAVLALPAAALARRGRARAA